jgi:transposase
MIIISVGGKMPKKIELRPLTEEEREIVEKLIKSQTAPAIEVERAKTIWLAQAGEKVQSIGKKQERTQATIYRRIKRFNELGLKSLADETRSGRPTTYTEEERGQMIAAARTHPQKAGRPLYDKYRVRFDWLNQSTADRVPLGQQTVL